MKGNTDSSQDTPQRGNEVHVGPIIISELFPGRVDPRVGSGGIGSGPEY